MIKNEPRNILEKTFEKKRDFGNGHFIDLKHIGAGAK